MDQAAMESYVLKIYDLSEKNREILGKVEKALEMMATSLDDFETRMQAVEKLVRDSQ